MEKVTSKKRHAGTKGVNHAFAQGRVFQGAVFAKALRQQQPGVSKEQEEATEAQEEQCGGQ